MTHSQEWNNRIVTSLFKEAQGDLMLDANGDLCWKYDTDGVTFERLPKGQHRAGVALATIGREGWTLTWDGAELLLCGISRTDTYDPKVRRHVAKLRAVQNEVTQGQAA